MDEFTPGPWYSVGVKNPGRAAAAFYVMFRGRAVAHIKNSTVMPLEANARLITAAPELLATVRAFMALDADFASANERHLLEIVAEKRSAAPLAAAVLLARAAISKATGEA